MRLKTKRHEQQDKLLSSFDKYLQKLTLSDGGVVLQENHKRRRARQLRERYMPCSTRVQSSSSSSGIRNDI